MFRLYPIVLIVCLAIAVALVVWRLVFLLRQSSRGPRPSLGRLLNEWAWTLVPIAVLLALLWRSA